MPSAKYSCSGSPDMFWNGSTPMEGLSGRAGGLVSGMNILPSWGRCVAVGLNLIGTYGLLDVLNSLDPKVRKLQRYDFSHLIIGHTGDAKSPGSRKRLQSRRDVHPITKQITRSDHHVTDMDPYAEVDLTALRKPWVRFGQGILSLHGTPDGIDRAAKLRQHTVASRVGYAASVRRNQPIQDFPARCKGIEGRPTLVIPSLNKTAKLKRFDPLRSLASFWPCADDFRSTRSTDIARPARLVRFVPEPEVRSL